jgi:hypothetical protein
MKITILAATDEGVVEYSFESVSAQFATRNRWDKYVEPVTLRTPPPADQFELRVNDFSYVHGHGTVQHKPDTPIYDQMKREEYQKAYGG